MVSDRPHVEASSVPRGTNGSRLQHAGKLPPSSSRLTEKGGAGQNLGRGSPFRWRDVYRIPRRQGRDEHDQNRRQGRHRRDHEADNHPRATRDSPASGMSRGGGCTPGSVAPQGSPVAAQGSTSGHKVVSQVVHGPVADDVARRHRVHVRWAPHPVVMPTTHAPKPTAPQTGSSASLTTKPSMKPPTAPPTKLPTTTAPTAPTGIPPLDLGTFTWIDSEGTCSVSLPVPFDAGAQSYEFSVGDIPSSCGSADLVIKVSVKPSSSGATGFFGVGAASSDISADIPVGTVYSLAATADSTYVIKVSGDGTFDVSVSL